MTANKTYIVDLIGILNNQNRDYSVTINNKKITTQDIRHLPDGMIECLLSVVEHEEIDKNGKLMAIGEVIGEPEQKARLYINHNREMFNLDMNKYPLYLSEIEFNSHAVKLGIAETLKTHVVFNYIDFLKSRYMSYKSYLESLSENKIVTKRGLTPSWIGVRGIVLIDDTHTLRGKINIDAVKNLIQNEIRTLVNRHKDWFEGLEVEDVVEQSVLIKPNSEITFKDQHSSYAVIDVIDEIINDVVYVYAKILRVSTLTDRVIPWYRYNITHSCF